MEALNPETIENTANALNKLTSSERGTFLAVMLCALIAIVGIVWFYVNSMDSLIEKYNTTINQQQKEFLDALKQFK